MRVSLVPTHNCSYSQSAHFHVAKEMTKAGPMFTAQRARYFATWRCSKVCVCVLRDERQEGDVVGINFHMLAEMRGSEWLLKAWDDELRPPMLSRSTRPHTHLLGRVLEERLHNLLLERGQGLGDLLDQNDTAFGQ
jgi:hypothetical protein